MFQKSSTKVFLWLVIAVLAFILLHSLILQNKNNLDYYRLLERLLSDRHANATKSRKSNNIINTEIKMPMAAISRNILDRYPEYRQIQRVDDFKTLYDPRFCVVELEGDKRTIFTAGTELIVRIQLYNGYNQTITQGGDMLNIWLRSPDKKSSVAGYVVDHMNGSYTGHVKAFWAGDVLMKVSVTNTKEAIGLFTNYVNEHGSSVFISATFAENGKSEMTLCAPKKSAWLNNKYGGFCDLTSENYNISLFCGKPKSVSCNNWVRHNRDYSSYYDNDTAKIFSYKDKILKQIKVKIIPSSKGDLDYPVPETPCNALPRALTWNSTVPSGFLHKGVYHNLICRSTVKQSMDNYRACLKGRPVISVGDSTTRQWFFRFLRILKIPEEPLNNANEWHKFRHAYDNKLGLDLEWQPHEHPFHGEPPPGSDRKNIKSVAYRLDRIPSNSNAIVILHWYAHISLCCDQVDFREHVRHAKAAIMKLLMRSPNVQIFFKGPHHLTYLIMNQPFAYIGMWVEQVLLEEFGNILHRVIFLDQWDMSVALENVNVHPYAQLDDISLNNLINFACKDSSVTNR